jgi:hypothetical protein
MVITFKADESLIEALDGVSNRSAFIRSAILAALDGACPLCRGTGVLSPRQRRHWQEFSTTHRIERCSECQVNHLVCRADSKGCETTP